jgi:hypothetical protein
MDNLKPITDFSGYFVSEDSVWSCWKRSSLGYKKGSLYILSNEFHKLVPRLNGRKGNKYYRVRLCKNGKRYPRTFHRLIYAFFNGPIPKGYDVHHIDFNSFNNHISNLQMLTRKEHNLLHRLHNSVTK